LIRFAPEAPNHDDPAMPDVSEPPYLAQHTVTAYTKNELIRQRLWTLFQATLFRFSPPRAHGFRARLLRMWGATIPEPDKVVIFASARIYFPWKLVLEPRSMVGRHVNLYNLAPIILRRGANISQHAHLCAGSHDFLRWSMPLIARPIEVGANAWIAADVFIGPGVTIGELAVIGARSVVVKDQPARMICAGNPCRPVKSRPEPQ
jgi:putative colanic acid biosynthesis acetyltransferase WcaF